MRKRKPITERMWVAPKHTLKPERTPVGWESNARSPEKSNRYLELADIALGSPASPDGKPHKVEPIRQKKPR